MTINDPHGTLQLVPEEMTAAQLRAHLEPYGTKYRLTMTKKQLVEVIHDYQRNLRKYGHINRPFGVFEDES